MGRLTKDVELGYTNSSEPMAIGKFPIAIDRPTKKGVDKVTDFFNCTAFGRTAENIEKYFSKGRMICIEGSIQINTFEKDGKRNSYTNIIVERFHFTGERKQDEGKSRSNSEDNNTNEDSFFMPDHEDDLPWDSQ